tara:strand:- start:582 stop:1316 length:735 start_codon:yes stop_codon:yes gene_type:complete
MDKLFVPGGPALYFGSLIHEAMESIMVGEEFSDETFDSNLKLKTIEFANAIRRVHNIPFKKKLQPQLDEAHIKKMLVNGKLLLNAIRNYDWPGETVAIEEQIYENLTENKKFKGYIDWIYKEGDIYHIVDFKTSGKGWSPWFRKSSTYKTKEYQLLLYKYFYSIAHDIPLDKIKTKYVLLKWGLKSNQIETIEVSSTERKIKKAVAAVKNAAVMLMTENRSIIKNRAACKFCPFEDTQYCTKYG